MLEEKVHPARQIEAVVGVAHNYLLQQFVYSFEDLGNAGSLSSIFRRVGVALDKLEAFVELVYDLNQQFSSSSLH